MRSFPLILLLTVIAMTPRLFADDNLKKPNVSGQFYPGRPEELGRFIDEAESRAGSVAQDKKVEMVVSPHAGYVYSGWVAAYGYKAIAKNKYSTVVIIGPSHFHGFNGVAAWPKGKFETPLDTVAIDEDFAAQLMKKDADVQELPDVFTPEHSLEVQLPFLQKDFKDFKIVPLLMGYPDFEVTRKLAAALNDLVGKREDVLVVISTDLSHYHPYDVAVQMDKYATDSMLAGDIRSIWNENLTREKMEMCGFTAVVVGLQYAQLRNLKSVELLRYANSGDATGDKSRVVGYSSLIFYKNEKVSSPSGITALNKDQKRSLLQMARQTVEAFVKDKKTLDVRSTDPRLAEQEGAFVTLTKHADLRGCIGNIVGDQPLFKTIRDMAIAAASQDPRFPPVKSDELADLEFEISVLSKPQKISDPKQIKLGTHGVIVSRGFNRGVFLPQVATETGWDLERFMGELCSQKAGLPADCWHDPKTTIEIFTADVFSEKDLK
jgi:AmmeMemoRadiSam system protein B/AmmeMemoRadiSam system protein A